MTYQMVNTLYTKIRDLIKWIEINDLSNGQYSLYKNKIFKTIILKSHLHDYSDVYIFVKGTTHLSVATANENDKTQRTVKFKENALLT